MEESRLQTVMLKMQKLLPPRTPYRGRACVGDNESNDQELQRQLRSKRSGRFSARPSQFKDRLARSKEKSWHQHFFNYAMMQTMESDGWDDLDDTLFDDGVEGQRIVPAQMVCDPFYNHQVVGGAPKAAEPVRVKTKASAADCCCKQNM